jgi:hypothetical protein
MSTPSTELNTQPQEANELAKLRAEVTDLQLLIKSKELPPPPSPCSDPLLESVYRSYTSWSPDFHCRCGHCGLQASAPSRIVRHMPGCELAKLYERAGGVVEFRSAGRLG